MRQFTCIAAVLAALSLAACGGGGGSQPAVQPPPPADEPTPDPEPVVERMPFPYTPSGHYTVTGLPRLTAQDAQHMPVYRDGENLFVGVNQGLMATDYFTFNGQVHSVVRSSGLSNLPAVSDRGGIEIRHGRLSDGAGRAAVAAYLSDASLGFASIPRWQSLPEVRLVGTSTAVERQRLVAAVQLVNAALPEGAKLTIGASSQARYDGIDVEFVDCWGARHTCGGGTAAASTPTRISNAGDGERMADAHVYFSRETNSYRDERQTVILLAHELMHALGITNHVASTFATIMEGTGAIHHTEQGGQPQPLSLLYSVDREALRALYGQLDIGDGPEDLGPWSANSMHLAGNGPHANFGVVLRNGYAESWATGPEPGTALADNRSLSGAVTWTGALLGFSGRRPVAGDAAIGVQLETLTGTADFTSLETWAAGVAPGAAGTGTTWLDGDLGYVIAVTGNTFRETGGDDGRLTGIFTGRAHEDAAGTLERTDLTAAFGAAR